MSSVLGTAGALNGATDFCVEGFVRRDPLDDGGSGNTMFFDFGLKLMARQATNTSAVTLEGTPVGSKLTYNPGTDRSEEHTSELQSIMRITFAVLCLKKKR